MICYVLIDSHEEIIAEAVESNVVESEVDLKAVLGEPDESHLKALEEQQEKHTLTIHTSAGGHQHESSSDEEEHGANHPSEGVIIMIIVYFTRRRLIQNSC